MENPNRGSELLQVLRLWQYHINEPYSGPAIDSTDAAFDGSFISYSKRTSPPKWLGSSQA
jgi:hypothetical protein